jgi:phosphatidylinositol glycan class O
MFGRFFDRSYPYPSFNVADLDSLDSNAGNDILTEIKGNDFRLLIGHIIGVDHAGHTFSASHSEIERKLKDTEQLIQEVIASMNEDTVLLVFGDHGMTNDGNHGGATQEELRSVLFAYSKSGFPMKQKIQALA